MHLIQMIQAPILAICAFVSFGRIDAPIYESINRDTHTTRLEFNIEMLFPTNALFPNLFLFLPISWLARFYLSLWLALISTPISKVDVLIHTIIFIEISTPIYEKKQSFFERCYDGDLNE